MKKLIIACLAILFAFGLFTACKTSNSQSNTVKESESLQSNLSSQIDKSSSLNTSIENETTEKVNKSEIEIPIIKLNGDETGELVKFKINTPNLEIEKNEILIDGNQVAKVLFSYQLDEREPLEKELQLKFADAVATGDIAEENLTATYYHTQSEKEEGGVTAKYNEINYYIYKENYIVDVVFYPTMGTGIKTQREEFEKILSSIEVVESSK